MRYRVTKYDFIGEYEQGVSIGLRKLSLEENMAYGFYACHVLFESDDGKSRKEFHGELLKEHEIQDITGNDIETPLALFIEGDITAKDVVDAYLTLLNIDKNTYKGSIYEMPMTELGLLKGRDCFGMSQPGTPEI